MANPERGLSPVEQATGSWIGFELAIPDFLEPVREAVDDIASLLLALLDILLAVLDVIKAFTAAFLDPLVALIEALIELIERLLNDLRNAGFYLHGDWYLLREGPAFRSVLGGFQAYERRMISRIIDPRDINRPNLSPDSFLLALFFYASSEADNLIRVLNFIRGLMQLFNQERTFTPRSLGTVTDVQVSYGIEGVQGFQGIKTMFEALNVERQERRSGEGVGETGGVDLSTIRWKLAAAPGNYVSPIARMPPNGFFLEVSTEPNPLRLQYEVVPPGTQVVEGEQNRVRGLVTDTQGRTIELTGGIDQISLQGNADFFFDIPDVSAEPRIYAFKNAADQSPIALAELRDGPTYILQRTFFVDNLQAGALAPGQDLSFTLKLSDMPKTATFVDGRATEIKDTDTFYVRVRPISQNVRRHDDFQFLVDYTAFNVGSLPVTLDVRSPNQSGLDSISLSDRGDASPALKITFPNANTGDYLQCVTVALFVLVLSRADLSNVPNEEGGILEYDPDLHDFDGIFGGHARTLTGLEDLAKFVLPQVTGRRNDQEKFWTSDTEPSKWRRLVFNRCAAVATRWYEENNPPPSVQKIVVDQCQTLLDFKLGDLVDDTDTKVGNTQRSRGLTTGPDADLRDLTLFEAMQSKDQYGGISLNPFAVGVSEQVQPQLNIAVRVDINDGNLPDPYSPSFYTTNNDEFIAEIEQRNVEIEQRNFLTTLVGDDQELTDAQRLELEAQTLLAADFLLLEDSEAAAEKVLALPSALPVDPEAEDDQKSSYEAKFIVPARSVKGSVVYAPTFYTRRGTRLTKLTYCRNAFDESVYTAAAFALNTAIGPLSRPVEGGWITARLGQLIPAIDSFLDEILAWVRAIAAAIESIAEAIRRFIEYLQARIVELQQLIQRLNAIIQSLLSLFGVLPEGFVLPLVSKGTDGLLRDLVTAQNKPFDSPNSYGVGIVVIAAAPAPFLDLFLPIFQGKE